MKTNPIIDNKKPLIALFALLLVIMLPAFLANTVKVSLSNYDSPYFVNTRYMFSYSSGYVTWRHGYSPHNFAFLVIILEGQIEHESCENFWSKIDWYGDGVVYVSGNTISLDDMNLSQGHYTIFIRSSKALVGFDWYYRGNRWFEFCTPNPYTLVPAYYYFAVSAWQFYLGSIS